MCTTSEHTPAPQSVVIQSSTNADADANHAASLMFMITLCTGYHCYMAPILQAFPSRIPLFVTSMSAPPTLSAFSILTLGRSVNAIKLFVPPAPAVHAAADLKARCFDFLANLLLEHSLLYSSAELIAAFSHIPGNV
jgi:hypothetical protein